MQLNKSGLRSFSAFSCFTLQNVLKGIVLPLSDPARSQHEPYKVHVVTIVSRSVTLSGIPSQVVEERTSVLSKTVDQCHHQVFTLKQMISTFSDGLFAHRFRDIHEEIRAMVITTIGNWCEELPSEFLGDMYLKYLAWAMSDRVGNPLKNLEATINNIRAWMAKYKVPFKYGNDEICFTDCLMNAVGVAPFMDADCQ